MAAHDIRDYKSNNKMLKGQMNQNFDRFYFSSF